MQLLEEIFSGENIKLAREQVKAKKGASAVDIDLEKLFNSVRHDKLIYFVH